MADELASRRGWLEPFVNWITCTFLCELGALVSLGLAEILPPVGNVPIFFRVLGGALGVVGLPVFQWLVVRGAVRHPLAWLLLGDAGRAASVAVVFVVARSADQLGSLSSRVGLLALAAVAGGATVGLIQGLAFRRVAQAIPRWVAAMALSYLTWGACLAGLARLVENFPVWIASETGQVKATFLLAAASMVEAIVTGLAIAAMSRREALPVSVPSIAA